MIEKPSRFFTSNTCGSEKFVVGTNERQYKDRSITPVLEFSNDALDIFPGTSSGLRLSTCSINDEVSHSLILNFLTDQSTASKLSRFTSAAIPADTLLSIHCEVSNQVHPGFIAVNVPIHAPLQPPLCANINDLHARLSLEYGEENLAKTIIFLALAENQQRMILNNITAKLSLEMCLHQKFSSPEKQKEFMILVNAFVEMHNKQLDDFREALDANLLRMDLQPVAHWQKVNFPMLNDFC